jgi:hypothetical protein
MRQKLLVPLTLLLLSLACSTTNLSLPQPVATVYHPPSVTPSPTQIPPPTATPLPPTREVQPVPAWVAEFADPILVALVNQYPAFKDDFSGYNLGWFYVKRDSSDGPFYAHIEDETLLLKIPDGREYRDSMVYNPNMIRRDFVLSVDFKFGKTQPHDILRFQFNQSAGQSVELDLSKHEEWSVDWSLRNPLQTTTGTYEYFSPEFINVTIILRGTECAFYLNHDPVGYLSNCRTESVVEKSPRAMSLHLLSTTGYNALIMIDNVKLWDLEKVPGLP